MYVTDKHHALRQELILKLFKSTLDTQIIQGLLIVGYSLFFRSML